MNVFVIIDEKNLENFYKFFMAHIYNTSFCGPNTSLNTSQKNYYFLMEIRDSSDAEAKYRKVCEFLFWIKSDLFYCFCVATIIPIIDFQKHGIDFTEYLPYTIENSMSGKMASVAIKLTFQLLFRTLFRQKSKRNQSTVGRTFQR